MKTYKKINDKVYVSEQIETEVDVQSLEARVESLQEVIDSANKQKDLLNTQIEGHQIEQNIIKDELKEIKKLK